MFIIAPSGINKLFCHTYKKVLHICTYLQKCRDMAKLFRQSSCLVHCSFTRTDNSPRKLLSVIQGSLSPLYAGRQKGTFAIVDTKKSILLFLALATFSSSFFLIKHLYLTTQTFYDITAIFISKK